MSRLERFGGIGRGVEKAFTGGKVVSLTAARVGTPFWLTGEQAAKAKAKGISEDRKERKIRAFDI
jgi:hypothetical protein